ncbi:MAG: hypothetical protein KDA80_05530 [Planctomycetaceae bacterium]|nr:hypothetical protein [Planctomycetaceae bacterium]
MVASVLQFWQRQTIVISAFVLPLFGVLHGVSPGADIEGFIEIQRARMEQVTSLEATIRFTERVTPDHDRINQLRKSSAKAMAKSAGVPVPAVREDKAQQSVEWSAKLAYSSDRGERHEYRNASGQITLITVFDGNHWRTLRGRYGTIDDGGNRKLLFQYLGLDYDLKPIGGPNWSHRFLPDFFVRAAEAGYLKLGKDSTDPQVFVSHPTGQAVLDAAGALRRHDFRFDPDRGMALVETISEVYQYGPNGEEFAAIPPNRVVSTMDDFQLFDGGVWLPQRYTVKAYESAMLPKDGKAFPDGFDGTKPFTLDDVRFETLNTLITEVVIEDLKVNEPLPDDAFALEFPDGTLVYDGIEESAFQVGEANPELEAAIARQFGAPKTSRHDKGWPVFLIVANLVVLAAGLVRGAVYLAKGNK